MHTLCSLALATATQLAAVTLAIGPLAACGGAQSPSDTPASLDRAAGLVSACREAATLHAQSIKDLAYLPPKLKVIRWIDEPTPEADGMIPEADLLEALRSGRARFVHVQARGGIGKSEMSKAIAAEICNTVPTFRADLRELFLQPGGQDANTLVGAVATQSGMAAPEQRGGLVDMLGRQRWVLVLDSIEELPAARRPAALAALAALRAQFKAVQVVVMGRPAVFDVTYGLQGLDGHLEVPPLDCGRARSNLTRLSEDDEDKARMAAFVETWHLDRQSLVGQQCYFPYLATYRDVQVVQRLAKAFQPDAEMGGLRSNLATVHEAILAERLLKELQHIGWDGPRVLGLVDAMVTNGAIVDGDWNLAFKVERCVQAQPGDAGPDARQVCEKIFQSVLFEPMVATTPQWKFGHQTIADLFVARWIEAQLSKTPGNCDIVTQQAEMIAGKEVAGYLVGRPFGAKCLAQVARALCSQGGFKKNDVAMLHKGLPLGPTRSEAVKAAVQWEEKNGKDACASKVVGAL
ncbi:MAG: hypothetical protein EXR79_08865 [Myxococcales bacterium]|nr:hypothetical protein [Myxococcales bacterium]